MEIDRLLDNLLTACKQYQPSRSEIKQALERVLVWLVEHDTDENCRKVDLFASMQITLDVRQQLPQDIADILFDLGGALHDTHTSPGIAKNFESTPQQLLQRTEALPG